jgi:hypothetical protein
MKHTSLKKSGPSGHGREVYIRSIHSAARGIWTVILCGDGGDCSFQHNMTPTEAREVAGYLLAEANYCEQADKSTDWSAA